MNLHNDIDHNVRQGTYYVIRNRRRKCQVRLILAGLLAALLLVSGMRVAEAQTPPSVSTSPTTATSTPSAAQAPTLERLEARVLSATAPQPCTPGEDEEIFGAPQPNMCQQIELLITSGSIKGQLVSVEEGRIPVANRSTVVYREGDNVLVDWNRIENGPDLFYITDFIRTDRLWLLALIFTGFVIAFGGVRGVSSLVGLIISFAVLLFWILPRITAGDDPMLVSIMGAIVIMVVTLYMSHGFSRKTTAALLGTSISLAITGILAWLAVDAIRLTGFGSEDAIYVQIALGGEINLRGLLLGSIIIGALGVLDDLTISQSAAVFELHNVDPTLTAPRLFGHVINIGRDHIAATVNTLVLAYAGASLPLLVLFVVGSEPWDRVINNEVVAEEVVRTLVGSIGLMAAVPITTWLASLLAVRTPAKPPRPGDRPGGHGHHH